MRVLYISGQRAKELSVLSYLQDRGDLRYLHIQAHLRCWRKTNRLVDLVRVINEVRHLSPQIILVESPGVAALLALIPKVYFGSLLAVRLKGDVRMVVSDLKRKMPLQAKIVRLVNDLACRVLLRRAAIVLPISNAIRESSTGLYPEWTRVRVVGIPFGVFDPENDTGRRGEDKFVLTVTNFNFWPKVEPLVAAVRLLLPIVREQGLKWVILGDGIFFERFLGEIGHADAVQCPGRLPPDAYYRTATAFFYFSGMDGLPNVLMEAALHRLPILINLDCPAIEFFSCNDNALCIDLKNGKESIDLTKLILSQVKYRQKLGERAYLTITKRFSIEAIAEQMLESLREGNP